MSRQFLGLRSPYLLGTALAAARYTAGLTQSQLAGLAGVSTRTIVRLENSDEGASVLTVMAVARALGLELSMTPIPTDGPLSNIPDPGW